MDRQRFAPIQSSRKSLGNMWLNITRIVIMDLQMNLRCVARTIMNHEPEFLVGKKIS